MPLVKLVVPLIAGVALYLLTSQRLPGHAFIAMYVAFGSWWLISQGKESMRYRHRWIPGVLVAMLMAVAGYHLAHGHDQQHAKDHFSRYHTETGFLLVMVSEPVREKPNSYQLVARVSHLLSDGQAMAVRGMLMLYLEKDSLAPGLRYGDMLLIENRYDAVRPPGNPEQFNYKRYLAHSNIHHSGYRRSGQWHLTGQNQGSPVLANAIMLQERALRVFGHMLPAGREHAVISALLLGYRDHLDEDLRREFAGAGAMHILCVSGLHVGIIYMVLKMALSFLNRFPGGQTIRLVLIMLIIWLYAAMTGLSPSVLRASSMFSFVAIGQGINRRTNIYNTLAASALMLIMINPYIITRIGFQLSYLAVISIVAIQPALYQTAPIKNPVLQKAWAIMTVSIAAQLATGPLALFYFNQFPNYFLLTNLIVIPLSALIIYGGLLTLLFASVPLVGYICSKGLYVMLMALQEAVKRIEQLPYATMSDVYISLPETLLLFMAIVAGCMYFAGVRRKALPACMGAILLFTASASWRAIHDQTNNHFVVYHCSQGSVIDFFDAGDRITLTCSHLMENPDHIRFNAGAYRVRQGAAKAGIQLSLAESGVFRYAGINMMILSSEPEGFAISDLQKYNHQTSEPITAAATDLPDSPPRYDYLLLCSNPGVDPMVWLERIRPGKVIADASNSYWTNRRWKEACMDLGISFWSVREQGAFVSRKPK